MRTETRFTVKLLVTKWYEARHEKKVWAKKERVAKADSR